MLTQAVISQALTESIKSNDNCVMLAKQKEHLRFNLVVSKSYRGCDYMVLKYSN